MVQIYGVQHIGLTVPDMEQAVSFFTKVFGAVTVMECGSVDVDDQFMMSRLGVPSGRKIADQRVIVLGNGGNLELFQYSGEQYATQIKQNSEVGAMHLAFEVDDAWRATEELRAAG